jgi:hypothetical protein
MLLTLIVSLTLSGAPKTDAKLVGTWLAGGAPFVTFNANGAGQMDDGKIKWSADGATLIVTDDEGEVDKVGYKLDGDNLTLTMGGMPIALTRAGAGVQVAKKGALAAKAEKMNRVSEEEADREAMQQAQAYLSQQNQGGMQQPQRGALQAAPQQQQPQGKPAGNDQISRLLLSSAWCSFTYNQRTGSSRSERFVYSPNGTWSTGSRAETYNSGANGTVSGQTDGSNGGRWEVRDGQLYMATWQMPQLQPLVGWRVTQNSNGYPIINYNGKEYSSCN